MSFLDQVEKEISLNGKKYNRSRIYFIYGLIIFSKSIKKDGVILNTKNGDITDIISAFFKNELSMDVLIKESSNIYSLSLKNISDYNIIKEELEKKDLSLDRINQKSFFKKNDYSSFLAATFLSCGSINEPQKGYHLEFSVGEHQFSEDLNEVLLLLKLPSKITVRRSKNTSVYIRESSGVEDFLTFIGASNSAMEIMNVKIVKDVRNRVNRETNFETANIERTASAYAEQIFDIQYIINSGGLDGLDSELKTTIDIRSAYPDLSLKALGEKFVPPISRSAVNYRLQKIRRHAKELRQRKEG